ncbi:hypothetical protein B5G12_07440 [Faecalibacterium sp. An58]|uniref:leucine-rich repeat domain-containing protein n=1 Tax=Faecalibacterium sp. An58 TaxID=1965648 RepID=UPI000B36A870|nr:leucine-rich repeat domain-containing protein [Faecalibacterium sp. An58]OUN73349.1 hypothetical protein B5G12_07440 [Faecalibacterium sp. An58]
MRLRRPIAFILSAALAASALTGCDSFSGHAAAAANSAQVQQLIEFIADLGLERDLRQALQKGGDLRQALLTLLGLENAVNFNVDGLTSARPGQHAVQVWEVTAQSAEDAAALAASQIRAVLEQLKSSGVTEGRIGMVEVDGKYYVVVDVEVTEENTFEPIRPASDGDDDSEDDTIPGVTVENGLLIVNVADLELSQNTDITAENIIEVINKKAGTSYINSSIKVLNLSGCAGLTIIDNGAFASCTSLTKIILPEGLETIGTSAFAGCEKLTTVTLPSTVSEIGNYAFSLCDNLTEITLPDGLKSIGGVAFAGSGLTKINLSGCTSLKSIGDSAFQNCTSLETVLLPERLAEIGVQAFYGCKSLTSIDLHNTQVKTIGNNAFIECTSLETITLPSTVTEIGGCAFQNCSGLENITFYTVPNTIEREAFKGVKAEDLIIHCPSGKTNDLKEKLKASGLSEDKIAKIHFEDDLTTFTYLLGL